MVHNYNFYYLCPLSIHGLPRGIFSFIVRSSHLVGYRWFLFAPHMPRPSHYFLFPTISKIYFSLNFNHLSSSFFLRFLFSLWDPVPVKRYSIFLSSTKKVFSLTYTAMAMIQINLKLTIFFYIICVNCISECASEMNNFLFFCRSLLRKLIKRFCICSLHI